jgi:N-acetylglucosamine kinase-like BadF-type ATPase
VDQAANQGDPVARAIIQNAAQQLATFTAAVRSQLFAHRAPARIAYVGGVFKSDMLLERFRLLVELEDGNQVMAPLYGPATGALIEAYTAAGLNPTLQNIPAEKY